MSPSVKEMNASDLMIWRGVYQSGVPKVAGSAMASMVTAKITKKYSGTMRSTRRRRNSAGVSFEKWVA
jgi:hypothetical protein